MEMLEKIILIIRENEITLPEITAETNIDKDSEITSFDRLMMLNAIEDEYAMEFDSDDFNKMKTLGDLVDILQNKYKK